jgi:hypothetical protein
MASEELVKTAEALFDCLYRKDSIYWANVISIHYFGYFTCKRLKSITKVILKAMTIYISCIIRTSQWQTAILREQNCLPSNIIAAIICYVIHTLTKTRLRQHLLTNGSLPWSLVRVSFVVYIVTRRQDFQVGFVRHSPILIRYSLHYGLHWCVPILLKIKGRPSCIT